MANAIIETIAPEKAQVYLNKSGGNRDISMTSVSRYAKAMEDGDWLLNGLPIVFDTEGRLIDGHHRLHACIKAGVPFVTFVVRGVENKASATIDCGRHRKVSQLIGMRGVKHSTSVAASLQFVYRLTNGLQIGEKNAVTCGRTNKSNLDMVRFYEVDSEGFNEAGDKGQYYYRKARILSPSTIGGTYYYLVKCCGYSKDFVSRFFDELMSLDTSSVPTIDLLRKKLIANVTSKQTKLTTKVIFALLVKTWNCYASGRDIKVLNFNPEKEVYPEFIHNKN